jgi:hypothetical protein
MGALRLCTCDRAAATWRHEGGERRRGERVSVVVAIHVDRFDIERQRHKGQGGFLRVYRREWMNAKQNNKNDNNN